MSLVVASICKICQVLDDGATNHDYCKRFAKQTEEENRLKENKKRIMNEILQQHYQEEGTSEPPEKKMKPPELPDKKIKPGQRKFKCGKCDFSTLDGDQFEYHTENMVCQTKDPLEQEFFKFPNFQGFNCLLKSGTSSEPRPYYVTEVCQPELSNHDNLSETCYFFLPLNVMEENSDLISQQNVEIPFSREEGISFMAKSDSHFFKARFPSSKKELEVRWAINITAATTFVRKNLIFILTKSRFKLIQSAPINRNMNEDPFCKFVDKDQVALENLIKSQTDQILNSCAPTCSSDLQPQVNIDIHKCFWKKCKYISNKKFLGIRNHILKHFKERIEEEAKPRPMLTENEKSNCMSRTGCSVPTLQARGELVHHFGIFHCLVDDLFQEYALGKIKDVYSNQMSSNQCPYQDFQFDDQTQFLEHLSLGHFFNLILEAVECMVKFNLVYQEDKQCVANVVKCPFCKKKFANPVDGRNVGDLRYEHVNIIFSQHN